MAKSKKIKPEELVAGARFDHVFHPGKLCTIGECRPKNDTYPNLQTYTEWKIINDGSTQGPWLTLNAINKYLKRLA